MKKIIFSLAFVFAALWAFPATGWYNDYILLNLNGVGTTPPTGYYWIGGDPSYGTQLDGANFGTVSSLVIENCDLKYWSDNQDRTGGAFYYKIMDATGTNEIVATVETIWDQVSLGGNDYRGTKAVSINLLSGLQPATTYKLHIWAKHWGTSQGDNWLSNFGSDYVATFTTPANFVFSGTGNWSETARWNFNTVPAATNNAIVNGNATVSSAATINALTINSGMSLTVAPNQALTVNGSLTNNAGATGLIIASTAAGTGQLMHNTASVPGTIQRFVEGSATTTSMKYHMVSVPLTTGGTSSQFMGSYLFDFNTASNSWNALGASTSTALDNTKGYLIYYPGTSTTYNFSGNLNNADFPISLSNAGQAYNLIPNPYPSNLKWMDCYNANSSYVDNAIYIWPGADPSSGNYYSWVNGVSNPAGAMDGNIAIGQSFFVHALATTTSFTFSNSCRTSSQSNFNKSALTDLLYINASINGLQDNVAVHFDAAATQNFDSGSDALKMQGGEVAPQMSTLAYDGTALSINALPYLGCTTIVPVSFGYTDAGLVTFTATGMETFGEDVSVSLYDQLNNQSIDLKQQPVYEFNYSPSDPSNRFNLIFGATTTGLTSTKQAEGSIIARGDQLQVIIPTFGNSPVEACITDMGGRVITTQTAKADNISLPKPNAAGVYCVKIISQNGIWSGKVFVK